MAPHIELIARAFITAPAPAPGPRSTPAAASGGGGDSRPAVLLCRSIKAGYHYLPGGHVEFGETAAQALARELREECGRDSRVGDLVFLTEEAFNDGRQDRHELNLVFTTRLLGPVGGVKTDHAGAGGAVGGGVFHVEHFALSVPAVLATPILTPAPTPAQAASTPNGAADPAQSGSSSPATIASLEPKIAFDWVALDSLAGLDLRPATIHRWLMALASR